MTLAGIFLEHTIFIKTCCRRRGGSPSRVRLEMTTERATVHSPRPEHPARGSLLLSPHPETSFQTRLGHWPKGHTGNSNSTLDATAQGLQPRTLPLSPGATSLCFLFSVGLSVLGPQGSKGSQAGRFWAHTHSGHHALGKMERAKERRNDPAPSRSPAPTTSALSGRRSCHPGKGPPAGSREPPAPSTRPQKGHLTLST